MPITIGFNNVDSRIKIQDVGHVEGDTSKRIYRLHNPTNNPLKLYWNSNATTPPDLYSDFYRYEDNFDLATLVMPTLMDVSNITTPGLMDSVSESTGSLLYFSPKISGASILQVHIKQLNNTYK